MNQHKTLKIVHLAGTIWFMLCTSYVFILTMHQAGFNWWIIFSLSGHLALLVMLLISLYLFSLFRGTGDSLTLQNEHPLTSSIYYMAFYVSTPLLGGIAGLLGMIGETRIGAIPETIALGTIGATFLTWVALDPVAGSLELLTPTARKYRCGRLEKEKLFKEQEQLKRELVLADVLEQERDNERKWRETLTPQAAQLAKLLAGVTDFTKTEQEAIGLGVYAWRIGGLACMKQLRSMAAETFRIQYHQQQYVDYVSAWWDGIGRWRNKSLV